MAAVAAVDPQERFQPARAPGAPRPPMSERCLKWGMIASTFSLVAVLTSGVALFWPAWKTHSFLEVNDAASTETTIVHSLWASTCTSTVTTGDGDGDGGEATREYGPSEASSVPGAPAHLCGIPDLQLQSSEELKLWFVKGLLLAAFVPGFVTVYSGFYLSMHGRELGFQEDYKYRRAYSWCTTLHDVMCVTALIVFTLVDFNDRLLQAEGWEFTYGSGFVLCVLTVMAHTLADLAMILSARREVIIVIPAPQVVFDRAPRANAQREARQRRQFRDRHLSQEDADRLPVQKYKDVDTGDGPDDCCPICMEDFKPEMEVSQLPGCRHVFCAACIRSWLVGTEAYPRQPVEVPRNP